ncbi:chaplin [Streptomyces sp. TRM68367]|uniref:chaplin n=1 Tax=Streptomyces sp. TRM68367 TaxID=2758415 RepID=UPI00165B918D|nr:chaplin [Streptomyces sp. TRM68367]MBC9727949.1 chaplin [Streptomyces sp. TRM68367]
MRRVARNSVIAVAAASGAMAMTIPASAAFAADGASGAQGDAAGSPGVISGNTMQLPVPVPVNMCGNTVNVAELLNPAAGNTCANEGGGSGHRGGTSGAAAAESSAKDSPGVLSGNGVQQPVDLPVNVSGDSVNVAGVGNPATGNESVNTPGDRPDCPGRPATPDRPTKPTPRPTPPPGPHHPAPKPAPQTDDAALAHTGTDHTVPALAGSAALFLTGVALYRRFRPGPDA